MNQNPNPFTAHVSHFSDRILDAKWLADFMGTRVKELRPEAREQDRAAKGTEFEAMAQYHDFTLPRLPDGTEFIFHETIHGTGREDRLIHALNAALRWLLVSCVEAFEGSLKDMYAEIGVLDPAAWHPQDVRRLLRGDDAKPFIARRRALQDDRVLDIRTVYNRLSRALPDLEQAGGVSECRFINQLHAELRHLVVHLESKAHVETFVEDLAGRCGHGLTDLQKRQVGAFFGNRNSEGVAEARLADRMQEVPQWGNFLRSISYQGGLVYWAACKKYGFSWQ